MLLSHFLKFISVSLILEWEICALCIYQTHQPITQKWIGERLNIEEQGETRGYPNSMANNLFYLYSIHETVTVYRHTTSVISTMNTCLNHSNHHQKNEIRLKLTDYFIMKTFNSQKICFQRILDVKFHHKVKIKKNNIRNLLEYPTGKLKLSLLTAAHIQNKIIKLFLAEIWSCHFKTKNQTFRKSLNDTVLAWRVNIKIRICRQKFIKKMQYNSLQVDPWKRIKTSKSIIGIEEIFHFVFWTSHRLIIYRDNYGKPRLALVYKR